MPETEKITINLGAIDLERIDALVGQGVYTTRTDFMKTATRDLLEKHGGLARTSYEYSMFKPDEDTHKMHYVYGLNRLAAEGWDPVWTDAKGQILLKRQKRT